jgi:hypothetical protein
MAEQPEDADAEAQQLDGNPTVCLPVQWSCLFYTCSVVQFC